MDTPKQQVLALESRLKSVGVRIDDVLAAAKVDRSTWTRWKQGKLTPKLTSWQRLQAAVDERLQDAAE
jgi:hypothetical protein